MDPKLVRLAKEIPGHLKEVMNSMFEQGQPALRSGVTSLRESLKKLDQYLMEVDREHLGKAPRSAKKSKVGATQKKRARGDKRFPISDFILNVMIQAGKPMRPVELAEKLSEATGRDKANASANIHTLLTRLREQKKVVRTGAGQYSLAPGITGGAPAKKARKARKKK